MKLQAFSALLAAASCGATVYFQDDFESNNVGSTPANWQFFVQYQKNPGQLNIANYVSVVSDVTHGGSRAVKISGSQSPSFMVRALPPNINKLYTRSWVHMSRQLGQNTASNHETLIGIKKDINGANDEIRFGEIKGVIGTNQVPSDNIAPRQDKWNSGPILAANVWHCIEVEFDASAAYDTLIAKANGQVVHSITSSADWQNGPLGADWMSDKFLEVMFGYHSFSGFSATLHYDDIVVADQPIGCGDSATQAPVTQAPVTQAPVTQAPVTQAPVTQAPVTQAPVTQAPVTQAPVTQAPITESPTTEAPVQNVCSINYDVVWEGGNGFGASIIINCDTSFQNWKLEFEFTDGQSITNIWNAISNVNGNKVVLTPQSYNRIGSSLAIGFNGMKNGQNKAPTAFAFSHDGGSLSSSISISEADENTPSEIPKDFMPSEDSSSLSLHVNQMIIFLSLLFLCSFSL